MLEYVKNNPYRILGVYANDPEKKWVENSLELFVSLKHDNTFAFPTDWSEALGPMYRTLKNVKDAAFILEDNDSRTLEALFWAQPSRSFSVARVWRIPPTITGVKKSRLRQKRSRLPR